MIKSHRRCPEVVVQPLWYHDEETGEGDQVLFSEYAIADSGQAVARPAKRGPLRFFASMTLDGPI
jgi:hypothetical protein